MSKLVYLDACVLIWLVEPRQAATHPDERRAAGRIVQLGKRGGLTLRSTSWMQTEHLSEPVRSRRIARMRQRCGIGVVSHVEEGTILGAFFLDYHRLGPYEIPPQLRPTFDLLERERGHADANHVCTVLVDGGVFVTTDFKLVGTARQAGIGGVMRPTELLAALPT